MNIMESFKIALDSILINKLRSILTMLGIIIGVGSVIAMTSLGSGLSNLVDSQISANGSNLIQVSNNTTNGYASLTLDDVDALLTHEGTSDIGDVAYIANARTEVVSDDAQRIMEVSGVSNNYFALTAVDDLAEGDFFEADEAGVVVLGGAIAETLFPDGDALGNTLTIGDEVFTVSGVLAVEEDGESVGPPLPPGASEQDRSAFLLTTDADRIFMPMAVAEEMLDLPTTIDDAFAVSTIVVDARDETVVESASEQITAILRETHNLADDANDDFSVRSQAALADTFSTITTSLTLFLGSVAGISLIVGGIGIMNIMLVSVTERTREIGIRKALGAQKRDILSQFVIEALVLSLIGGIIGLLLGWGISAVGGVAMGLTATLSVTMVMIAIGFSTLVGLIFGIYPAWQAANLAPIIALRYE
ncbi:MAG: ABC transporter permease [Chloroflexota bacterium]